MMTEQSLAAWESTTVQNIGPMIGADDSDVLWIAVLANRERPDAAQFAEVLTAIIARHPGAQGLLMAGVDACTQLRALIAAGSPPAKE